MMIMMMSHFEDLPMPQAAAGMPHNGVIALCNEFEVVAQWTRTQRGCGSLGKDVPAFTARHWCQQMCYWSQND